MQYFLTGKQMQQADRHTIETIGIPSMVLMERAALGVVQMIEKEVSRISSVLVVCGSGNNGGDGYAIARLFHLKGYQVFIYFVGNEERRSEENLIQKKIAEYYQIPVKQELEEQEYSVIIDAVFGTGLSRDICGKYAETLELLNQMKGYKVAVDMPSGISDETGKVMGTAFRADITVALGFLKRGHVMISGNPYVGKVVTVDIGIHEDAFEKDETYTYCYEFQDFQQRFPKRKAQSHKGTYGKVLLIVGSQGMAGAAILCARAAYMTGAGLVQIYTHEDNRIIIQESLPEAMVTTYQSYDAEQLRNLLAWADVVGIGCGLGMTETARRIVEHTIKNTAKMCVVDADALNLLANNMAILETGNQAIVLTPHMKEMARLLSCDLGDLIANKVQSLSDFIKQYSVTCVLKDARTLVGKAEQPFFLNMTGNCAMAKGGSGDVLCGIISGILAQGASPYEGACLGVYLHGMAGDLSMKRKGQYSVLAGDIVENIGEVLKKI